MEAVFETLIHRVRSSLLWIFTLQSMSCPTLPILSAADMKEAEDMFSYQFLKLLHRLMLKTSESGTYPHHSAFFGGKHSYVLV